MKKILMVLMAFMLIFVMVGCSDDSAQVETPKETTTTAAVVTTEAPVTEAPFTAEEKEAFKVYLNEDASVNFGPKNDTIVMSYAEAIQSGDLDILFETLNELLVLNANLYEDLEAYEPTSDKVAELHAIFFDAVASRELSFVDILAEFTNEDATDETLLAAFDTLSVSDEMFLQFLAKIDELKAYYGF